MPTKEVVKKEVAKQETAVSPFVIFQTELAEIHEAIEANVGDAGLSARIVGQFGPGETFQAQHEERPAGGLAVGGQLHRQGPSACDQAELFHGLRPQISRAGMVIGRPSSARMKSMISITSGESA